MFHPLSSVFPTPAFTLSIRFKQDAIRGQQTNTIHGLELCRKTGGHYSVIS